MRHVGKVTRRLIFRDVEHDYSSAVWNGSKCSKAFHFFGAGTFRTLECFITSHCSSLPQSLYDKTHTLQKEQLVYNLILPPSAPCMLFIRTWLRAVQEHNSTDPPVFDSEEIVDLKYQATEMSVKSTFLLVTKLYCLCSQGQQHNESKLLSVGLYEIIFCSVGFL